MSESKYGQFVLAPRSYFFTAIASVVFAFIGFSYNAWRMEVSEDNNNTRIASFQILQELAELELIVFAAHYDSNEVEGSPRKGWVKVNLIHDLSYLAVDKVRLKAQKLQKNWQTNWPNMVEHESAAQSITHAIDNVRIEVVSELKRLD
ncbi:MULTISPECIES: hypothetical protein [Pseudoalteromonas]|jgi:hypothetical protein|uniref:Uncharacterized protein n=1 Tax=Pseudoalteromonas aliena SW19 TaxID=1314866 RepID=A0ABR9DVD1_9GAMM|nr:MULTISPECIES: hypothetical protein [Pseudoalteromonas]MBB1385985.1 hypothetical protein [Pseudoalteromonas sp. SG45-5]MBB1394184.1 hypothetical protein [Pseudoalteromonas sp. SG44-4]MBB1448194.1 hypothetical protein [Pseudoalteromonas sp. SG41-6]MBE0358290.1 hypothetical protein [Pseudoalteromonas aliena SW19]TMN98873.1 hypothetical protein CWB66_16275 [Pseudoalteromonas sp. S558]